MSNYRVISHSDRGGAVSVPSSGKKVAVPAGTFVDLPYEQLNTHIQGVMVIGQVGTTAQRPLGAANKEYYLDTTLSKVVFSDGKGVWYDPFTGGAV